MKKIILFSLCVISANLVAGSEWRRGQIAGRTGNAPGSQTRRQQAQPLQSSRPVIGAHRSAAPGLPGGAGRQRWGATTYIPGIGREQR